VDGYGRQRRFGVRLQGYVHAPEDGLYCFAIQGDDRSALYLDEEAVVVNPSHDQTLEGAVPLRRGWHRLRVDWYQREGGLGLRVRSAAPGQPLADLDAAAAIH
jgi:hexosaminidase